MSNHNFKPGDLAVIINSGEPSVIGMVCKILSILLDDKEMHDFEGELHRGSNDGSPSAFVELEGFGNCFFDLSFLIPLRGDFKPDEDDVSFYDLRTGRQHLLGGRA